MILYGQITNEVLLLSYSIVFSEKLRGIMYILSKLDHSAVLQARNLEETAHVVLKQCKTKEEVMALEENLSEQIYVQCLVCLLGNSNVWYFLTLLIAKV